MHRSLKQHWAVVESRGEPIPGAVLLVLSCASLAASAMPGQFVMLRVSESSDPYLRIPLPIHRIYPHGVALLINDRDIPVTLFSVGSRVDVLGPAGHADRLEAEQSIALIALGGGIAPLMSFVDSPVKHLVLLAWVASAGQVYPPQLVPRSVEYFPYVGEAAAAAFYTAMGELPRWAQTVFAAGDKAMYTKLNQLYREQTLPLRHGQVKVWLFTDMACGTGACRGCVIPARRGNLRCCQDGPFIDLADLDQ